MGVIAILILISLTVALLFLAGFIWAVKSGQYEDTFTPSLRVLTEEETVREARVKSIQPAENLTKTS
jgi:cbb3-type cytochrome oxidase maturation protein